MSRPTFHTIFDMIHKGSADNFDPNGGGGFYMSRDGYGWGDGIVTTRGKLSGYGVGFGLIGGAGIFKDLYPDMGEIDFIRVSLEL